VRALNKNIKEVGCWQHLQSVSINMKWIMKIID
jgi:hypothetical protein